MNIAAMKRDLAEGLSITRIGQRQGMGPKKAREILEAHGAEVSDKRWQPDMTERDARIRRMLGDKRTVRVIVEAVGCSTYAVTAMRKVMREEGTL